jgi:hypothetical protein
MVIQQGTVPGQTTVIYGAPTYGPGYGGYGYGSDLALVGDLIVADVAADVITDVIFGGEKKKKKKNKNKKNNQKL